VTTVAPNVMVLDWLLPCAGIVTLDVQIGAPLALPGPESVPNLEIPSQRNPYGWLWRESSRGSGWVLGQLDGSRRVRERVCEGARDGGAPPVKK
jgi:hypothetical protein